MSKKVSCEKRKSGVCGTKGCPSCFPRSFSAGEHHKKWSKRNNLCGSQVAIRSRKNYWMDCNVCRHQYTASPGNIFNGHGCPYCSNRKRCGSEFCSVCFNHSFASDPLSVLWSKNNDEEPVNISIGSDRPFLFFCGGCGNEYKKSPVRMRAGERCNLCVNSGSRKNRKVLYNKSFASSPRFTEWSPKNPIDAKDVPIKSGKIYFFACSSCGHEYESSPYNVHKSKMCPHCCGRVCKFYDESGKEQKIRSFAEARWSRYWSQKNNIPPEQVSLCSSKKFWLVCPDCSHEFHATICNYSDGDRKCPFCTNRKRCGRRECKICFEHSFASREIKLLWSHKNKKTPLEVSKCSQEKFLFGCPDCGHEFSQKPDKLRDRKGCPYCGGASICFDSECSFCWTESFAASPRAKFWSEDNNTAPRNIRKGCSKKYEFICEKNHKFKTSPRYIRAGSWCPLCKSKTEAKVFSWLLSVTPLTVHQARFSWCINPETGKVLPFDICVADKFIIEIDGRQHFEQVSNWTPVEETQKRDRLKEELAEANGFKILRLSQEQVWEDSMDWKSQIKEFIKEIF
nr:putative endonuclease [Marseillevirus cajuinensis]